MSAPSTASLIRYRPFQLYLSFESGVTAALLGTVPSVLIGGVGTIAVALIWMKLFPPLRDLDRLE